MAKSAEAGDRVDMAMGADALLATQQRYIEAWRDAGQIMADAVQTVIRRQAELAQAGMREFWADGDGLLAMSERDYRPGEQLERMCAFWERALGSLQETSEIMLKAQSEAMRALTDRAKGGEGVGRKAA